MKLLLLCREPRLYSCSRLKQAAESLGYKMDILDPNRFLLKLEGGNLVAYYQQGDIYEKDRCLIKVDKYHGVIGRFGTASTMMGCNVLRHFELQNIPCLNQANAFALARDKWSSLQKLYANGIAVPETLLSGNLVASIENINQCSPPLVIKTLQGSQGVGVMLIESHYSAQSMLDTLNSAQIPTLTQKFIQEAQGKDIRVFVIGDKIIAVMERQGRNGDFRANIHQGGNAHTVSLTKEEQELAIRATKVIGLDVAGVDLIRTKSGLMVLEVNASPGLEMIEKVSQIDIAREMILYLLAK